MNFQKPFILEKMDINFDIWNILRVIRYLLIIRNLYILSHLIRWAYNYLKNLIALKDISHMPIIPIIGNAHQLKPRHGCYFIIH